EEAVDCAAPPSGIHPTPVYCRTEEKESVAHTHFRVLYFLGFWTSEMVPSM
ncbi:MAG: hypothetical protein LQ344_006167, partial [Seirophora lacunosa]